MIYRAAGATIQYPASNYPLLDHWIGGGMSGGVIKMTSVVSEFISSTVEPFAWALLLLPPTARKYGIKFKT